MSFVRTKSANEQHVTASAYVACAYACVASENQPLVCRMATFSRFSEVSEKVKKYYWIIQYPEKTRRITFNVTRKSEKALHEKALKREVLK